MRYEDLLDIHAREIHERYGEDVIVNFGWATADDAISSKVYGWGEVITTYVDDDGKVKTEVEQY